MTVLLFFDANPVLGDPRFRSPRWHQLAALRDDFGVCAVISEVSVLEVVAGYRRQAANSARDIRASLAARPIRHLQLGADEVLASVESDAAAYEDFVRQTLQEHQVTVMGFPDVSHETLVQRAIERQKPNDENGNGYRDTLIWLTLLDVASRLDQDDYLVFVTADGDFVAGKPGDLHHELRQEFATRAITCTVTSCETTDEAVNHTQHLLDPDNAQVARIKSKLNAQLIQAFVEKKVLSDPSTIIADSKTLALLPIVSAPRLVAVEPVEAPHLVMAGPLDDGALLTLTWPVTGCIEGDIHRTDEAQAAATSFTETKRLDLHVDIVLDKEAKPQHIAKARVVAPAGDPGHAAWDMLTRSWTSQSATAELLNARLAEVTRTLTPQIQQLAHTEGVLASLRAALPKDLSSVFGAQSVVASLGAGLPKVDLSSVIDTEGMVASLGAGLPKVDLSSVIDTEGMVAALRAGLPKVDLSSVIDTEGMVAALRAGLPKVDLSSVIDTEGMAAALRAGLPKVVDRAEPEALTHAIAGEGTAPASSDER